ncbi:MAG: hypothetical protein H6Q75_104 [Firmicutes bacterium]|nr:hypothetical protein [Bacillota bacterium]
MDTPVCEELAKALRDQRHQFINHIQVIYALVELKRIDKALQYMDELSKSPELLTDPLKEHDGSKCQNKKSMD